MSKLPIFKLPIIKHPSDKSRQDFIIDMIFVSVGGSVLKIGLTETFTNDSEIRQIHKNKNRKEYKKVKELHDELAKKEQSIRDMICDKDRQTIYHKTSLLNSAFIREIGLTDKCVNLEYLGICILDVGLNRKRKSKRYDFLDSFCNYKTLYKNIGANIEKAGINLDYEYEIAVNFVKTVKY